MADENKQELGEGVATVGAVLAWYRKNKTTIWALIAAIGTLLGYAGGSGNVDPRALVPDSANVSKLDERVTDLEENVKITGELIKALNKKVSGE